MIRRLIILLLIVGCYEVLEPEDCAGVVGGTAVEDDCGVCEGDGCVYIANVVRNPTESESVTLKNSYFSSVDISGWTLGDKNDTLAYNISQETSLEVGEEITFNHTTLTFQINDYDEIIYLKNTSGITVDIFSYSIHF